MLQLRKRVPFWAVMERIAAAEGVSLPALLVQIDAQRGAASLASACRVRALQWVAANPAD